jgi:hypothetical protein
MLTTLDIFFLLAGWQLAEHTARAIAIAPVIEIRIAEVIT